MMSSEEVLALTKEQPKVLYLNIVVQDASEAVQAKVKQKVNQSSHIPKPLRSVVANRAAKAASGIASPPMIASMLGEKMPQKMMDKMEEKGITCSVHEVFREGPYVVFQMQVLRVNAVVLANSKKGRNETEKKSFFEMGSWVGYGLGLMGTNNQQWVEGQYLPKIVQKKLEAAMGEVLSEKLEKRKMVADTLVLNEERQARYFFARFREVQSLRPSFTKTRIRNSNNLFKRSNSQGDEKTQQTVLVDVIDGL